MTTQHTFRIGFAIRKDKSKEVKARIYVCITVDSRRVDLSTKMDIALEHWNE